VHAEVDGPLSRGPLRAHGLRLVERDVGASAAQVIQVRPEPSPSDKELPRCRETSRPRKI
jgi:hypothetical protein